MRVRAAVRDMVEIDWFQGIAGTGLKILPGQILITLEEFLARVGTLTHLSTKKRLRKTTRY